MDGELRKVHINDIQPGPIVHESLPEDLLNRIRTVHGKLSVHLNESLEQFEVGFMRDVRPEKEVVIWESLADAYEELINANPTPPTADERTGFFEYMLAYTMGSLSVQKINEDPFVKKCCECYVKHRAKRT